MAPTICSEKKAQQRSGINDIRKQSTLTSLYTSPTSRINYAQKRSKIIRPYQTRSKRSTNSSVYHISSSSDASNDTNKCFHLNPFTQLPPIGINISDNSISTPSESTFPHSAITLTDFSSTFAIDEEVFSLCEDRLKPFNNETELSSSSVYTISSSDEEQNVDDDMSSRSINVIATSENSQEKVTSTITDDDEKISFRSLSKLHIQDDNKNTKGLFEIAIKMIKLVHRNQLLQRRLSQLQAETSQFIQSVLANPENQAFRDKVQVNGCCEKIRD